MIPQTRALWVKKKLVNDDTTAYRIFSSRASLQTFYSTSSIPLHHAHMEHQSSSSSSFTTAHIIALHLKGAILHIKEIACKLQSLTFRKFLGVGID